MISLDEFFSVTLGLTKFPLYLPTFYLAFFTFLLIHQVIAPYFSSRWFPKAFGGKSRAARNNWSIHVVSQVHALIVVPYALWCLLNEKPEYSQDRAFGWNPGTGHLFAISCGYFFWDTFDAIVNFIDPCFVAHGVICSLIFSMAFKPFLAYYGVRCLLWETSTIFLNNHWFLDKLGRTGTRMQAVNGFFLLSSFFSVRLVYGFYISNQFFLSIYDVYHEIPLTYALVYGLGNVVLQCLNWFWFFKMISALRKRFEGKSEERTALLKPNRPVNDNGVVTNGA